ncbi:MAG: hypothetical protein IKJ43_03350 [Bacilli bacterium]|nr:hypothetical protein [Bacilli bacterium]
MNELFDYIAINYDSFLIEKNYYTSLRNFLVNGLDADYIDDINILKMFYDIYLDVKEKFDESLLSDIKKINDKYLFLMNRIREYEEFSNYKREDFIVTHKYFEDKECIDYVKEKSMVFSFDNLFSYNHDNWFCGVCFISKVQTVCMYNDDSFGFEGSGYHDDSFHEIMKAIYNEEFVDDLGIKFNSTGQDIKVVFSNGYGLSENGPSWVYRVIIDIPVPINSGQLESLKLLNNEIKKYQEENDVEIKVSSLIVNYYDDGFFLEFDNCHDLDDVLDWVIISDDYEPDYTDKNIVGFLNGENCFNLKNRRVRK